MGTILDFPLRRTQRSPVPETALVAQIVIFPGVRIERDDGAAHQFAAPGGPKGVSRSKLSEDRDH